MNTPRIAIETRVLPVTNHRGTRVIAHAADKSVIMPWGRGRDDLDCHRLAAEALRDKMGWKEFDLICGHTKRGMVWVMVDPSLTRPETRA